MQKRSGSVKVILTFLFQNSRGAPSLLKDTVPVPEFSASGPFEGHDLLRRGYA